MAYKAEIDVKVRNLGSISQLEKKLSSISKNVNAINKKNLKGGAGGSKTTKDPLKDEIVSLKLQNTALSNINRAQRAANKLKKIGVTLEEEMAALKKVASRSIDDNLSKDRKIIEEQKKKIQNAEKLILTTQKQQKAQTEVAKATQKTLTAQERINVLRLSGGFNKAAGGMGGFIDSQRKGAGPNNLLGLPSSKDIQNRGIQRIPTASQLSSRPTGGITSSFTATSVEKAELFEKRRNAAIARGVEENEKLIGSERIRNRQAIKVNKAIDKQNKLSATQATRLRKLGDSFGKFGRRIEDFQQGLTRTRGSGGRMLALPSSEMLDTRVRATGQGGGFGGQSRFAGGIPKMGFMQSIGATKGFDMESALISGAFPLLFGQGPIGAAAGALGGGVGGMFGGMGGFAGGIAATAIVQQIQGFLNGISELGNALGPFTQNTQAVTDALGLQGSAQEAQIKLIEQVEGKTAAFNAATAIMARQIGRGGVDAIEKFANTGRLMSQEFAKLNLQLQTVVARIINFTNEVLGLSEALERGEARDIVAGAAGTGNEEAQGLLDRRENQGFFSKLDNAINNTFFGKIGQVFTPGGAGFGGLAKGLSGVSGQGADDERLSKQEKIFAAEEKTRIQAGATVNEGKITLKQLEEEIDLRDRIKQNELSMKTALAEKVSKVQQEFDLRRDTLDMTLDQLTKERDRIKENAEKRFGINTKEQENIDIANAKIEEQKNIIKGVNDEKLRSVELTVKLHEATTDISTAFEKIGESIASGVSDNLVAAIQGTKSLGDAAKSILNDLSSSLIRLGVNTILGGIPGFGGLLGFASGGNPPVGKPSLVGEKGPELFVPKRSGTIIPNDKLGGGGSTNISVNVDASGSSVQGDEQQSKELGRAISAAIQSELLKQRRPGGLLR